MSKVDIVVPALGESIQEATIAKWHKKPGEYVKVDDILLELETEKVTLEVNALSSGVIENVLKNEGDSVKVGELLGHINPSASGESQKASNTDRSSKAKDSIDKDKDAKISVDNTQSGTKSASEHLSPAVHRIVAENNLNPSNIIGTGKDGRITKGDALSVLEKSQSEGSAIPSAILSSGSIAPSVGEKPVEKVKMSRLRKTIAQRLKDSQNTAAILTTFNEIDMSGVMALRQKYKDLFEKEHGVKLGFMSFFVKAVVAALKQIPAVNAEIECDYIIYKNYYDIGVAVGTEQGLVVPVLRDADKISFAGVELKIAELGKKARDGKLSMADLSGGTFSISNGGIYGSLLSTPIINPPQSGILGMHKIQERPVAIEGKVEIRPMMYIALSYDHRIIDGKEAVTFLVKVKEAIESPDRLLLEI